MEHRRYTLEVQRPNAKSRRFRAELVGFLSWKEIKNSNSSQEKPLFLVLAGSVGELRPFLANLRGGYRGHRDPEPTRSESPAPAYLGLDLKTIYREQIQATPTGDLVATVFAPDVFSLDPVPGTECCFVGLPTREWLDRETRVLAERGADDPEELALARYVTAFLDRRTPFPIPPHPELHRALYRELRARGHLFCAPDATLTTFGLSTLGFASPVAVQVPAEQLESLLRDLLSTHLPEEESPHGSTRIAPGGWVLSPASGSAAGPRLRF